ncbi:MAG: HAMP domain-containing protein, partial [Chloroflexi bacterium]|nr:HAMP domain-containing protein [Chloroflexota bacterium]
RIYSAQIHGTLHPGGGVPEDLDYDVIHSSLPPINEFATPGVYIQIIDRDGRVVVKSDNLGVQELPIDPKLLERGFTGDAIGTVSAGSGARLRIIVSPLYLLDETLLLEVAQSLRHVDATMSQVRWALLGGVLVALMLSIASGAVLVRRTLGPVERITRTAQAIEASHDLGRRVGYKGPADEIGRLATTFDHMIEHLDKVFKSQKDFVADASHDLRSPLTVLRGNIELLTRRDLPEGERRKCLDAVAGEIERMTNLVNDLLLLAEIESGETDYREPVPLRQLLNETLSRAQLMTVHHTVTWGRIEDVAPQGSPQRLRQLLDNLVDNAIKYTPEGGTITLSAFRDGDWACLEVTDTGVGIAPEHLPHLFDRFYRVDRARSRAGAGTGLGLAIVKEIAERHGGTVSVQSIPGKGSTFTVRLKL